ASDSGSDCAVIPITKNRRAHAVRMTIGRHGEAKGDRAASCTQSHQLLDHRADPGLAFHRWIEVDERSAFIVEREVGRKSQELLKLRGFIGIDGSSGFVWGILRNRLEALEIFDGAAVLPFRLGLITEKEFPTIQLTEKSASESGLWGWCGRVLRRRGL